MQAILQQFSQAIGAIPVPLPPGAHSRGPQPPGNFLPVNAGGLGGFPWRWQLSGGFNSLTYDFVNNLLKPAAGGPLQGNGLLTNAYASLLEDLSFRLSPADQSALAKAGAAASAAGTDVVNKYQASYGTVSALKLAAAGKEIGVNLSNALDYVIAYVAAYLWSGSKAAGQPPVPWQKMANGTNNAGIFKAAPAAATPIVSAITTYLNLISASLPLIDKSGNAAALRQSLLNQVSKPSVSNGGLSTIDPHGVKAFRPLLKVSPGPAEILNGLMSGTQPTSITYGLENGTNGLVARINQLSKVSVPNDAFSLGPKNNTAKGLLTFPGTGQTSDISTVFSGKTVVRLTPGQWFNGSYLAEANTNGSQLVTGPYFSPKPGLDLGRGGDFGVVMNYLISQYPMVNIHYPQGDINTFLTGFQLGSKWTANLPGMPVLGGKLGPDYHASVLPASSGFNLQLTPDPTLLNRGTAYDQAYVLGAKVAWPFASITSAHPS